MVGSYDYRLVALSILISVLAAYAARSLARRLTAAQGGTRAYWLIGGAAASGIGAWSMHYTGMLAFELPVPVLYHWPTVLISFLPAFFSAAVALLVVSRSSLGFLSAVLGGVLIGGGISALHYVAMAAMLPATCRYSPALVALSVAVAMVTSVVTLRLAFPVGGETGGGWRQAACVLMWGATNPAMHYTGMAATSFTTSAAVPDLSQAVSISSIGVAGMSIVPMMVLGVAVLTSLADRLQAQKEQMRALAARLQAAREEERTKVAREIHDELGQALTAIKIDVSSLSRELPADKKPESDSILKLVDGTIQSVRRISTDLRPAILDNVGLVAAIEWAAEEFGARTGIRCRLELPAVDVVIDPERATALFRILQEALTNVARHAGATQVRVRLIHDSGSLSLEIHDNGIGITEKQLSAGNSLGILGMRERALLLGGDLLISGDKGTTVTARIPESHPTPPKLYK